MGWLACEPRRQNGRAGRCAGDEPGAGLVGAVTGQTIGSGWSQAGLASGQAEKGGTGWIGLQG